MDAIDRRMYRILVAAVVVVLAGGTVFYHLQEHWSWVNAWYFCVVTLATVGYGDLVPHTDVGKLFTTFYILLGVGIITTFATTFIRRRGIIAREKYRQSNGDSAPTGAAQPPGESSPTVKS